jgi:hypothetical protein
MTKMTVSEFRATAFAAAEAMAAFKPTGIARLAAQGGGYFPAGVMASAMAEVAAEAGITSGPAQPVGDNADYIRQPICWLLADGAVRCDGGACDRMHFRPAR